MPRINARGLKCTLVLDANEIVAIPDIGAARVVLNIAVQDFGTVTADIASKSPRRAQSTVAEHGVDAVAVIIQGKLISNNRISECGLVAQHKVRKAEVVETMA